MFNAERKRLLDLFSTTLASDRQKAIDSIPSAKVTISAVPRDVGTGIIDGVMHAYANVTLNLVLSSNGLGFSSEEIHSAALDFKGPLGGLESLVGGMEVAETARLQEDMANLAMQGSIDFRV